jgi:hypothetical protein
MPKPQIPINIQSPNSNDQNEIQECGPALRRTSALPHRDLRLILPLYAGHFSALLGTSPARRSAALAMLILILGAFGLAGLADVGAQTTNGGHLA